MREPALTSFARDSFSLKRGAISAALAVCLALFTFGFAAPASASPKSAALVMDAHTGQVLYSRNADEYRFPASLTKVMTLYMLFEKLEAGDITLKSRIKMTPKGAGMPPSKLGLRAGETLTVEDAILALVTRSANDVASATGAFIAGTEDDFAARMTKKARALGMSKTTYKNASGLPDKNQRTTARDQATLAKRIKEDFPQYYAYFSTEQFTWGKSRIQNHNRLLGRYQGTTGLKTGYTRASGFNLTATVERDDKFLIGVVMGGEKAKIRDDRMVEILDQAFPRAMAMKQGTTRLAAATPPPPPVLRPAAVIPAEDRNALLQLASAIDEQPYMEKAVASSNAITAPAPVQTAALAAPAPLSPVPVAPIAEAPAKAEAAAPVDSMTAYAVAALRSAEGPVRQAGREIGHFLVAPANASVSPDATANPLLAAAVANDPARTEPSAARAWRDGDPLIPEGTWVIQIGAYADEADAVESIRKAVRAAPSELGNAVPVTIPVQTADSRTLYRSRFGGFEGERAARNACGRLARQAIQCIPIPPTNWAMPQSAETKESKRG